MEAFLVSTGVVAIAEIGDKTQLLAFFLSAKFRKPVPIVLAIFVATIANHAFAGALGSWVASFLEPQTQRWVLGASFIAMALWTLVPDKLDDPQTADARFGVFGTTLLAFFVLEMGDKTQVATIALAAQYQAVAAVVAGTTLGMMLANVPAVFAGAHFAHRLPQKLVRSVAAGIFAILGLATLAGAGARLGF